MQIWKLYKFCVRLFDDLWQFISFFLADYLNNHCVQTTALHKAVVQLVALQNATRPTPTTSSTTTVAPSQLSSTHLLSAALSTDNSIYDIIVAVSAVLAVAAMACGIVCIVFLCKDNFEFKACKRCRRERTLDIEINCKHWMLILLTGSVDWFSNGSYVILAASWWFSEF